jgi:hypothetical protein
LSAEGAASQATGAGQGQAEPSEEEIRAAYEAELSRITATDMMAQAAVSLLNIGARRLAPASGDRDPSPPIERDLDQARDAIDAVKALLEILERRIPQELVPLRDALSRLQMAYAREIQPGAPASAQPASAQAQSSGGEEQAQPDSSQQPAQQGERPPGPGPAESSGRLWVPGR